MQLVRVVRQVEEQNPTDEQDDGDGNLHGVSCLELLQSCVEAPAFVVLLLFVDEGEGVRKDHHQVGEKQEEDVKVLREAAIHHLELVGIGYSKDEEQVQERHACEKTEYESKHGVQSGDPLLLGLSQEEVAIELFRWGRHVDRGSLLDVDVFVDWDELAGDDLFDEALLNLELPIELAHLSLDIHFAGLAFAWLHMIWVQVLDGDLASGLARAVLAAMIL